MTLPKTPAARLMLGLAPLLACLLLALAPAARAQVTEVGSLKVGLQPRDVEGAIDGYPGEEFANPNGNPILPESNSYVVYWDPDDLYHQEWQRLIDTFEHNVGAASGSHSNVFAVDGQYTDAENKGANYRMSYHGSYTDTHKYPTAGCTPDPHPLSEGEAVTCLTDQELREELQSFVTVHKLPTGTGSVYYLLTPPGVTVCLDAAATHCSDYVRSESEEEKEEWKTESYKNSFCSYHSYFTPGGALGTIVYAAIPWVAGGEGDYYLPTVDQTQAFECQDGGNDPTSKPIEQREEPKPRTESEQIAFEKADGEEKEKSEEARAHLKPHEQEPEQVGRSEMGDYGTGLADLIIGQIANEQQDIVTDPLLNAWQGQGSEHREVTDECRNFFAQGGISGEAAMEPETFAGTLTNQTIEEGHYYIQEAFSVAAIKVAGIPCIGGLNLDPKFTAPNTVNMDEVVSFDGMESNITLRVGTHYTNGKPESTYATYAWKWSGPQSGEEKGFAPGAPECELPWLSPCAASIYHIFTKPGKYSVTLTVRDIGGNEATSEPHVVQVLGAEGEEAGSGGSGGSQSAAATPAALGASPTTIVTPSVTAEILRSQSLGDVLGKGLAVHYTISEAVGGRFELLLPEAVAHRFGIKGSKASVKGQLEVGEAKLSTSAKRAGASTVHIHLYPHADSVLRGDHSMALVMQVQLVVFNTERAVTSATSSPMRFAPIRRAHHKH